MINWYPFRVPKLLKYVFSNLVWQESSKDAVLYLTFDDGPIPEVTPWVLDELDKRNIPATFFCIGDNIVKHGPVFDAILEKGHSIGNHTYNHLNGWRVTADEYMLNIEKCQTVFQKKGVTSRLFRPPYGRIKRGMIEVIREKKYRIIMWDVLTFDFDKQISPEQSLRGSLKAVQNGSIIVFHDSLKSKRILYQVLPQFLDACLSRGYQFKTLK